MLTTVGFALAFAVSSLQATEGRAYQGGGYLELALARLAVTLAMSSKLGVPSLR